METKNEINENEIVSKYMETILTTGTAPSSVFIFAQELEIEEREFYKLFGSFEEIEKRIFALFFENTLSLLEQNEDYVMYNTRDKLLGFYYTFIEIITENRSFVLKSFENKTQVLKTITKLNSLKTLFGHYIPSLGIEKINIPQEQLEKIQAKSEQEFFWLQFLYILKFWMEDSSPSFEKTDVLIEKITHATFDALNTTPLKSLMDLGKFLLKEKMNYKM